jgi:hypothetical protein
LSLRGFALGKDEKMHWRGDLGHSERDRSRLEDGETMKKIDFITAARRLFFSLLSRELTPFD